MTLVAVRPGGWELHDDGGGEGHIEHDGQRFAPGPLQALLARGYWRGPVTKDFNPDQPRDSHGRWAKGGELDEAMNVLAELDPKEFGSLLSFGDDDKKMSKKWKKAVRAFAAMGIMLKNLAKYSEDQPRDEAGRWTSGGVAVAGGEDMANAASEVVSLLRERFVDTYNKGEYRWALNEYQKAWLGQSEWMTPEMADQAVRDNLIKTPNYTGYNDPTPERVDAVSEVVDSLKDIPGLPTDTYPLPVFVIVGGSGYDGSKDNMGNSAETLNEGVVMVYDNGTDTMYPEAPFDPQQTLPSSMQDVLLHEYGHAVQSAYGHTGEWERIWGDYALSDEYEPDGAMFKRPEGGLSFYAGTNPAEGFAEAFLTAVRITPEQYDGLRPESKALVDYVREKVL